MDLQQTARGGRVDKRHPHGTCLQGDWARQVGAVKRALWTLVGIAAPAVALDQATKRLADLHVQGRGILPVVEGFLELRYARNPGAFFSLGAGLPPGLRQTGFVLASLVVMGLILRLYGRAADGRASLRAGLILLWSGALGNLIDRIARGEVVDFIHLRFGDLFHWATFNLADVYIALGVALLLVESVRSQPLPRGATSKCTT